MSFLLGALVGSIIGAALGLFMAALCVAAKRENMR